MAVLECTIVKKLKQKEAEIKSIGKVNCALEDRVRSLCIENQIWQNLARSNEAMANELRSNMEQVLAQANEGHIDNKEDACAKRGVGEADTAESPKKEAGQAGPDFWWPGPIPSPARQDYRARPGLQARRADPGRR
ncbi:putative BOI-related E3 ubiquitin-protein ligase 2 [Nymphaea thermarum]|nr:putative BOI-related E3 ubiquitin-protein ligase 2 [Nymphaea thermarum]